MSVNESNDSIVIPYKATFELQKKIPLPAAARVRQGKILIATGTIIAMLGIAVYCMTIFIGDMSNTPVRFLTEGLFIISAGLAIWIVGAVKYLNAAIDIGYSDDSL